MKIEKYRSLAKELLADRLAPLGFKAQGDHLYLQKDDSCFALLRVRDKYSNIFQEVNYLAVVRHNFLPDLEGKETEGLVSHPVQYPFKMNPTKLSKLKRGFIRKSIKYTYESCNLGHYDTFCINYGEQDPREALESVYVQLANHCVDWLNYLTPQQAYEQIQTFGKQEYIEKIWLEAYCKYSRKSMLKY